jgi:hypothetical protein
MTEAATAVATATAAGIGRQRRGCLGRTCGIGGSARRVLNGAKPKMCTPATNWGHPGSTARAGEGIGKGIGTSIRTGCAFITCCRQGRAYIYSNRMVAKVGKDTGLGSNVGKLGKVLRCRDFVLCNNNRNSRHVMMIVMSEEVGKVCGGGGR